jgi:endonuclease/exonuclease/phosphatase family metal-dependent hydrolase
LRIAFYNIQEHGRGRLEAIADVLRALRPDAVALAEADETSAGALGHALGMEARCGESNALPYHPAWLTRPSVAGVRDHRPPALAKTLLELDIGALKLFVTHLASTHEAPLYPQRREIEAILDIIGRDSGPHLLVGDFNALGADDPVGQPPPGVEPKGEAVPGTPREIIRRLVDAGYVDCFRALHPREPGFTYPAQAPWLRLDYAFASSQLAPRLVACDVVTDARASDHLPLVVELG